MDNFKQTSQWVVMKPKKREDVIIDANIKLMDDLAKNFSNHEDKILVNKIMETLKETIEIQRGMIKQLEDENEYLSDIVENVASSFDDEYEVEFKSENMLNAYMPLSQNRFETDKQLKKAFSNYLQYHNAKKLSKFTAYDYCSRVKNLWKPFYSDWQNGKLDEIVNFSNEGVVNESPLLNVYNNIYSIMRYVNEKFLYLEKGTPAHKNWANASAALNKFEEFKQMVECNE